MWTPNKRKLKFNTTCGFGSKDKNIGIYIYREREIYIYIHTHQMRGSKETKTF